MLEHVPQAHQVEPARVNLRGLHLEEVSGHDRDIQFGLGTSSRLRRQLHAFYFPAVIPGAIQQATVATAEVEEPPRGCNPAANEFIRRIVVSVSTFTIVGGINPPLGVLRLVQSSFEIQVYELAVCTAVVAKLALGTLAVIKLELITGT